MSPCCLLKLLFFHHWDVLVSNSVLSRSCIVLIYPYLLVHEIKIHAQPRRHRHSPLHLRKASNWCPWNDLKILTLSPKFHFTQCIQIVILPSCWFCLRNYIFGLGHLGCFLAEEREKHFLSSLCLLILRFILLSLCLWFDNWYSTLSKLTFNFFIVSHFTDLSHPCV